ncbi:MAG: NADH-quinone oxidoreductase subunit [Proteobacteria bacterium]|nr:NADH-quinone oxidoreductase subunit [Pseudomonadota bacterium]
MNADTLLALLPMIAVAGASVVVMLAIALKRDFRLAYRLALGGLLLAVGSLWLARDLVPIGITGLLVMDGYSLFFSALLLTAALVCCLFCGSYFSRDEEAEAFVLLLTATLGGMMLVASVHLASFFLGLEIVSVSLFPLIAFRVKDKASLEGGVKYLILSGVASALLLFGMALLYGALGVLSFQELAAAPAPFDDPLVLAGVLLMLAGLGFKLSLVPFHLWTPDVYQSAPAPVTAFLATVSKGAVFALLLRLWVSGHVGPIAEYRLILGAIAALSVLGGNLLALLQDNLKRMLAYSSIAHMGYALVAFVAGSALGSAFLPESVAFYLGAYVLTNLVALGTVSALSNAEREADALDNYRGLFWRAPAMAGILAVSLLSLAGIPLTVGFVGKFYVFAAGVEASLWWLIAVVVVGSGLGLYYYLRVVLVMLDRNASDQEIRKPAASTRLALASLTLVVLGLGIFPEYLMQTLMGIARTLS